MTLFILFFDFLFRIRKQSFVYLIFTFRYYRKKKQKFKAITYLYKIAIPYGCTTMFFTIYQLVDSITLSILLPKEGYYTAYMFETVRLIFSRSYWPRLWEAR